MAEMPEQKAQGEIDADSMATRWIVHDNDALSVTAGLGIALCESAINLGSLSPTTCSYRRDRRRGT
jgi:hypothetical protein